MSTFTLSSKPTDTESAISTTEAAFLTVMFTFSVAEAWFASVTVDTANVYSPTFNPKALMITLFASMVIASLNSSSVLKSIAVMPVAFSRSVAVISIVLPYVTSAKAGTTKLDPAPLTVTVLFSLTE